ncbi:MAG TPA: glycosyltransferase family 87 protein [Candidatus Caenarcaniphilales bacterium]|nr:glycosyltransferase family 87 protein [Candidatus Caenarcaniphilales bacterium]
MRRSNEPRPTLPREEAFLLARSSQLFGEPRRLAAILLLGLTGGIVLAFLIARGELAGADARAYWAGVRFWLDGGDPYAPASPFLPYAYAPWTLYVFLPWALLPWDMAWFVWRGISTVAFVWSVGWAYERRPLATALLVVALSPSLAANLDTGNINVLLVLAIWAAHFVPPVTGGLLWAFGAALKWIPAPLILFIPARARLPGFAWLAVFAVLTLATWPHTLRQLDVVLNFPRPIRLDYLILAWAAVPWLWAQAWPPAWVRPPEARRRLGELLHPMSWLRSFLGLPAGRSGTSRRAAEERP